MKNNPSLEPVIAGENPTKPAWPVHIGGIYLLTGRAPLALRVLTLDGETVHYIHHETASSSFHEKGDEFGTGSMSVRAFRVMCQPGDQSPIPELLEALKKSKQLASIGYRIGEADMRGHDKIGERYGKQQDELVAVIDAAIAKAEGRHV